MGAIVTRSSAENFVRIYKEEIIQLYRYGCGHLELDTVETDGQYIWGKSQDTNTWVCLAEADEEMVFWIDNRNIAPPKWGTQEIREHRLFKE